MSSDSINALTEIARKIRIATLEMIHSSGSGHTGGSLSSIDILVCLYFHNMNIEPDTPDWPDRDRFVMSKGHSAEGYYQTLAHRGYFQMQELESYHQYRSKFTGHPTIKIPGVEFNTGALGHGLPVAVGMALAAVLDRKKYHTYVLMGDGELAEGSVWEAAMAASNLNLHNITAIIDRNRLQISGDTESVMRLEDLQAKWTSFGWNVTEVDGHDMAALSTALTRDSGDDDTPRLVIAHTVKGKGVSFIENRASWHHRVPTDEELSIALTELEDSEDVQ